MFTLFDHQMMTRAMKLAQKGRFTTAPNPNVGCVITQKNVIVGEGFHARAGEAHAEVHALQMAKEKAEGATVYVTLEPCSHYGRTPPCAEGLIKAKVAKVICAMSDPNPQVSGRGIQMLKDAGIEVVVGLLEADALALNKAFIKRMKTGMPFVQLKLAASLDGQTALQNGQSQWITSPQARHDVQVFRAQAGAILSTSQTVMKDNASLTVRWHELPSSVQSHYAQHDLRQPIRVILDRQKQLAAIKSLAIHVNQDANTTGDVISLTSDHHQLLNEYNKFELNLTLAYLAQEHHINHIWVEAGSTLAQALLQAQLVDEVILYFAPKIMGSDGQGLFGAFGFSSMTETLNLDIKEVRQVGSDIRITAVPIIRKDK